MVYSCSSVLDGVHKDMGDESVFMLSNYHEKAAAGGPKSLSLVANGSAVPESQELSSWLESFGVLSG